MIKGLVCKLCHIKKSIKSALFPHHNIPKYAWTYHDGKNYQIDHILIDKKWYSSRADVWSFRGEGLPTKN